MDMLSMCRICLDEDVTMHSSLSIKLQDLYEKLTAMPFQTEDRRPLQVCYICHARLQSCYRLQVSCLRSEDLLTKMLANNQLKPKPLQSANTLGIEHPLVQLSCVPVTMEENHDDEDHHDVEPMNMVDIHIKEEKIEDTEENTTEELSIQYTSPADIVKVEPVDVEDHDASGYSHHMMHQSYSLDIDSKHEVSIQHTEPALRNVDRITQNDLKPTCNMLSIEFGDNELLKPIKETSAHLVQDKKLAEEFINIQSALTRQHKTEVKYESQIKCKSKIQTGDKHMKMKKKVFRVSVTAGEKPFKCDVCEKTFMQSLYLQRHMRVHTGEKPFKCDMCKKWFKQKQHLMQHIRIHTGEKPYKCNICEKRFNQKYNLTQHNRLHTGEKPYICDMCNKSFNQKHNLIRHIKVHTGEKPYKCDLCEKCFMQRQDLTRHTRIHTGEKPYKCDVCGKAFNGSQTLKQHLRIHTGEKPFKCDICDEYFRMKPSLSRHMWMQHRGGCSLGPYCEDAVDPASILTHTSLESARTEHMSRDQD